MNLLKELQQNVPKMALNGDRFFKTGLTEGWIAVGDTWHYGILNGSLGHDNKNVVKTFCEKLHIHYHGIFSSPVLNENFSPNGRFGDQIGKKICAWCIGEMRK